ncbi:hypothetical protein KKC91_02280 [bacterium]|nr:hypothetical protein [bacterium]
MAKLRIFLVFLLSVFLINTIGVEASKNSIKLRATSNWIVFMTFNEKGVPFKFELTKQDLNGYKGEDILDIEVCGPDYNVILKDIILDDGNEDKGWKEGPEQIKVLSIPAKGKGVYQIKCCSRKGIDMKILNPFSSLDNIALKLFDDKQIWIVTPWPEAYVCLFDEQKPIFEIKPQGKNGDVEGFKIYDNKGSLLWKGDVQEKREKEIKLEGKDTFFRFKQSGCESFFLKVNNLSKPIVLFPSKDDMNKFNLKAAEDYIDTMGKIDWYEHTFIRLTNPPVFYIFPNTQGKLLFNFKKRDCNGYAGEDILSFTVYDSKSKVVLKGQVADDGESTGSWQDGPPQDKTIELMGNISEYYKIVFQKSIDISIGNFKLLNGNFVFGFMDRKDIIFIKAHGEYCIYIPTRDEGHDAFTTFIASKRWRTSRINSLVVYDSNDNNIFDASKEDFEKINGKKKIKIKKLDEFFRLSADADAITFNNTIHQIYIAAHKSDFDKFIDLIEDQEMRPSIPGKNILPKLISKEGDALSDKWECVAEGKSSGVRKKSYIESIQFMWDNEKYILTSDKIFLNPQKHYLISCQVKSSSKNTITAGLSENVKTTTVDYDQFKRVTFEIPINDKSKYAYQVKLIIEGDGSVEIKNVTLKPLSDFVKIASPLNGSRMNPGMLEILFDEVKDADYYKLRIFKLINGSELKEVYSHQSKETAITWNAKEIGCYNIVLESICNQSPSKDNIWINVYEKVDTTPPKFYALYPPPDDELKDSPADIKFKCFDLYGDIDVNSIKLIIDSIDVSDKLKRDTDLFYYKLSSPLKEGKHICRLEMKDTAGNTAAKEEYGFFIGKQSSQEGRITFDNRNNVFYNGFPYFMNGIYSYDSKTSMLKLFNKYGINTLLLNDLVTEENALERLTYNIKNICGFSGVPRKVDEKEIRDKLEKGNFLNRRYLLAYELDEPDAHAPIESTIKVKEIIKSVDPNHPTAFIIANFREGDYARFAPTTDILMYDIYPLPDQPITSVITHTEEAKEAVRDKKPIWYIAQAFHFPAIYRENKKELLEEEEFQPNPIELRNLIYQGLMHGANGYLFYACCGGTRIWELAPASWEMLKRIAYETHSLRDVFMFGDKNNSADIVSEDNEQYDIASVTFNNKQYIFVLNMKREPGLLKIKLNKIKSDTIKVLFENRVLYASENILVDVFSPLEVHIYEY